MHVTIVIPTFNRAALLPGAVDAALAQTHRNLDVLVVDDGSTDDTARRLEAFATEPRVSVVRLERNRGCAAAMNLGLLLAGGEAVTFHASDDIPARDKIAAQLDALCLGGMKADPELNWGAVGRRPGEPIATDAVLSGHVLIAMDGTERVVQRSIRLVEDLFPNVQVRGGSTEEQILVEPGLFRRSLFERLGGFADSVEAGRDLRNRILMSGGILNFLPRPLLTKFECAGSLTRDPRTDHRSARRARDRMACWARLRDRSPEALREPVDLSGVEIAAVQARRPLAVNPRIPTRGDCPSLAALGLAPAPARRQPAAARA